MLKLNHYIRVMSCGQISLWFHDLFLNKHLKIGVCLFL